MHTLSAAILPRLGKVTTMARNNTINQLEAMREAEYAKRDADSTTAIREALRAEFDAAKNAQAKALDDATKLKIVSGADKADKSNLYQSICTILEHAKERNFSPFLAVSAINVELGQVTDAMPSSIRQYRSFVAPLAAMYFNPEQFDKARAAVKDADGKTQEGKELHRIGYNTARKLVAFITSDENERLFKAELDMLTKGLKECTKVRPADKEKGLVRLEPVAWAELIAAVRNMRRMVPERKPQAIADAGEKPSDALKEALQIEADADSAQLDEQGEAKVVNG